MGDSNATVLDSIGDFRHLIFFGILSPLFVLSVPCYLYIFIEFFRKRRFYRDLSYHSVLIILIVSFVQVISEQPLTLSYLHNNIALVQSEAFCMFWSAQDFVLGGMILMLMCHSSIERYLLIFHRISIFQHLIVLHYLPIVICLGYPLFFYIGMIYFYSCVNSFDYTSNLCGGPCFVFDRVPSTFDLLFNLAFFESVSVLMNVILTSRVLHQKYRMRQQNMWKKNRRLLIQVLSITSLHNLMLFFIVIFMLIELFSPIPQLILLDLTYNVLQYGIYLVHLLCPFVSLLGLSKLWPHSIFRCLRRLKVDNEVQPVIHIPLTAQRHAPQ